MARGTSLRRLHPVGSRHTRATATVESLTLEIGALVVERQQLRSSRACAEELEHNRLEIVHAQWQLGRALIERHLPHAATRTAA